VKAADGDEKGSQLLATGIKKSALVIKATFFEKKANKRQKPFFLRGAVKEKLTGARSLLAACPAAAG